MSGLMKSLSLTAGSEVGCEYHWLRLCTGGQRQRWPDLSGGVESSDAMPFLWQDLLHASQANSWWSWNRTEATQVLDVCVLLGGGHGGIPKSSRSGAQTRGGPCC